MRQLLFIFTLVWTATACKDKNTAEQAGSESCYAFRQNGSEALLQITSTHTAVAGKLIYAIREKDKNTGTISGQMKGDTLFATYLFTSEGIQGQRDAVFLKSGDSFIEGRGKLNEQTGNLDLSDKSQISFEGGLLFLKTDCGSVGK